MSPVGLGNTKISTDYAHKNARSLVDIFRSCIHSFEVYLVDSSKMIRNYDEDSNFNRFFLKLKPRSHQTFRSVLAVKLMGIMFRNR